MPSRRPSRPKPFYDPQRSAYTGRWVVTTRTGKTGSLVVVETYRTEFEARKAMGLRGGSTDPHYVPQDDIPRGAA